MKYVATINGKKYEVEVEKLEAYKSLDRNGVAAPAAPVLPASAPVQRPAAPAPAPVAAAPAPAPAPEVQTKHFTLKSDVLFNFNKATLKPEGQQALDQLYTQLSNMDPKDGSAVVLGYTDRIGKDAYNMKLSQRRADAVKTYLVNKGVNANVITATGKGKADPVVNCPNPSKKGKIKNFKQLIKCLQPNRRAVIEVTGTRVAK